jgi:carboxylesterase type B
MIQEGHGSKVPFIIGSNRYDSMAGCSTFPDVLKAFEHQSGVSTQVPEASPEFGRAALNEALQNSGYSRNITDSQWNAIQAEYPLSDFPSASVRLATLFTQAAFSTSEGAHAAMIGHCASELFAKEYAKVSGKDVFLYSVDAIEGNDVVQHGDELPFVFHHVDDKFAFDPLLLNMPAAAREDMAHMFGTYWGAFARKQNPNAPGLPKWSRFSGTAPFNEVLEIKTTVDMTVPPYQGKCDFWQSQFGDQTSKRSGGVASPSKLRR